MTHKFNTKIRIFTTRSYVRKMKTLDPDYIAPEQFSKMEEGWDDFSCACVCVEFHLQLLGSSLLLGPSLLLAVSFIKT